LAVAAAAAQTQRSPLSLVPPAPTIRIVESQLRNRANRIFGAAIDSRRLPISRARLQLRSLANGRILGETRATERGEFVFTLVEPGTYVVELTVYGHVLGVSDAATIGDGEDAQVLIQLGGRWDEERQLIEADPAFARFAGASAVDTMTGATMTNAANEGIRPVDPGEPVSGQ
jgi:hypothetical protein